jgi:hypothetical protein
LRKRVLLQYSWKLACLHLIQSLLHLSLMTPAGLLNVERVSKKCQPVQLHEWIVGMPFATNVSISHYLLLYPSFTPLSVPSWGSMIKFSST